MHEESVWESIKAIFGVSERRMKYYTWHKHSLGVRQKFVYLPIDDTTTLFTRALSRLIYTPKGDLACKYLTPSLFAETEWILVDVVKPFIGKFNKLYSLHLTGVVSEPEGQGEKAWAHQEGSRKTSAQCPPTDVFRWTDSARRDSRKRKVSFELISFVLQNVKYQNVYWPIVINYGIRHF